MAKYLKTEQGYKEIETTVAPMINQEIETTVVPMVGEKMDKNNPVGTGSFSMGRKPNTVIGSRSHAEGVSTIASGESSHAEGGHTTASGIYSHAEGSHTTASGYHSHAEGGSTTASGDYSHAEGGSTTATGSASHAEGDSTKATGHASHAEGFYTKASSQYSHAEGKYNIEDTANKYAHIVGNGTSWTYRSNAHTLDWNGVGWFKDSVKVGGVSQDDSAAKTLATTEYVDTTVSTKISGKQDTLIQSGAAVGQIAKITAVDDTGKPTAWEAADMPTKLPNPNALTFTGAVSGTYDGSAPLEVVIPSGGGGGSGGSGKAKSQILIDQEITELTASLSVTLEHDFHNLTAIINCGLDGAALTADSDGTAVASKICLMIDATSFGYNSRKVAYIDTSTGTWKSETFGAEWSDDLSVFKRCFAVDIDTAKYQGYFFPFGGVSAMYGTLGTDDNAPRTGKTANIVVNGAYLNVGTRVVLWGEYYE